MLALGSGSAQNGLGDSGMSAGAISVSRARAIRD
jgi:hypothetical protein